MGNINIEIKGYTSSVVDRMLERGFAKTKTEALRLAIFEFDLVHNLTEDGLYCQAASKMLEEIRAGKEKVTRYEQK